MKQLIAALSLFMALGTTNANAQAFELPKDVTPESMIHTLMECRAFYMVGAEAAKRTDGVQQNSAMIAKLTGISDNFLQFSAIIAKQYNIPQQALQHVQTVKVKDMIEKTKKISYPKVIAEYKDGCSKMQQSMVSSLQKYAQ